LGPLFVPSKESKCSGDRLANNLLEERTALWLPQRPLHRALPFKVMSKAFDGFLILDTALQFPGTDIVSPDGCIGKSDVRKANIFVQRKSSLTVRLEPAVRREI
jgi:hypothetical protein